MGRLTVLVQSHIQVLQLLISGPERMEEGMGGEERRYEELESTGRGGREQKAEKGFFVLWKHVALRHTHFLNSSTFMVAMICRCFDEVREFTLSGDGRKCRDDEFREEGCGKGRRRRGRRQPKPCQRSSSRNERTTKKLRNWRKGTEESETLRFG